MITGAVIQARYSSTRLPGKVLAELMPGYSLLDVVVMRARRAATLDRLIVATSDQKSDDALADHCRQRGFEVFRGSETDVLDRFIRAAQSAGLESVVRLTGDNPLIDGSLIDDFLAFHRQGGYEYSATTMMGHSQTWGAERTFPRGVSLEVMHLDALEDLARRTSDALEREHVTLGLYDPPGGRRLGAFAAVGKYAAWRAPELRLTVDTAEDFAVARAIFAAMGDAAPAAFSTGAAIDWLRRHPEVARLNAAVSHRVMSEQRQKSSIK